MENSLLAELKGREYYLGAVYALMLECLGTATLVYGVNMTGVHPIGIPMVFFIVVMYIGPISGGHINPAVTLAVNVIKYKDWKTNLTWTLLYLAAELA